MTFPPSRLERPIEPPATPSENRQDVVPASERNQDPERNEEQLALENSRPLTEEERKAADRDAPVGERVYAPASERVPRTVPDYRDVVEHTDMATQEREAVADTVTNSEEPSFTRVPRPSTATATASETVGSPSVDYNRDRWMSSTGSMGLMPMGIGWLMFGTCAGVGVWLFMRWRRERNKPMNRLRRRAMQTASQARQRAYDLRDRMPDIDMPDEAARPAVGLGTALLSLAIVLWQQSQSRSRSAELNERSKAVARRGRKAAESVSDIDWQQRLMQLKELWDARRLELERISIPKR